MKVSASTYINELNLFREDLNTIMGSWPSGPSFDTAKKHAETIAPLIAGQIQELQNAAICLNAADPMKLRSELEKLRGLMTSELCCSITNERIQHGYILSEFLLLMRESNRVRLA